MKINRREAIRTTAAAVSGASVTNKVNVVTAATDIPPERLCPHDVLTEAGGFYDVSRGNPKPYSLMGQELVAARLTRESWRLEITADTFTQPGIVNEPSLLMREFQNVDNTGITFDQLRELGKTHGVKFIKAMQCLNIPQPLGQGLWEGVPLSVVLRKCRPMKNVRRIYFRGFHNDDPKQIFQSSVSYTQAMETPPGELPIFLAYSLNGEPITLQRGGPVRMIVPWAHGFKSIKWLQQVFATNDYRNNDTYALSNNDPESFLKTAAYLDRGAAEFSTNDPIVITGQAINGYSGLRRVEYWMRELLPGAKRLDDDSPELRNASWKKCELAAEPDWNAVLPTGTDSKTVMGFDRQTGKAISWPLRYGMISFYTVFRDLKPGKYEIRVRAIDQNGFAQPEPRSIQKSGKNEISTRRLTVK